MKHTLALFLKTGCVVCIFLLLCLAAVHHFKPALSSLPVFSRFERKLPIYCVDTDKPQVAISFDAAWGNEDTETLLSILDKYNVAEIQKPHDKVKELTGTEMTLFGPPYGDYNNTLIESANALGYYVVQWSVDSLDWKDYGADSIVDTILNHKALGDGAIILMHNGAKYTKDALERVITGLQDKGYEIVPISQLIYTGKYHMDNTGRQFKDE